MRKVHHQNEQIRFKLAAHKAELVGFAASDIGCIVDCAPTDTNFADHKCAGGFCKLIELLKSVVPFVIIHAHKDGAFLLNGFNFFCRAAETVIRIENFRNQCFLRELVGPHGSVHKRGAAACVFVEIAEIGRVKLSGFAVRNSDSRHAVKLH